MSKSPKSVSFEEYRDKSWHNVCNLLEDVNDECDMESSDHNSRRKFNNRNEEIPDDMMTSTSSNRLPTPLEPKEYLIPSLDPARADLTVIPNWWKSKVLGDMMLAHSSCAMERRNLHGSSPLCNNYIMPSSLAPVEINQVLPVPGTINTRTGLAILPPPTAFRDDCQETDMHKAAKGSNHNGVDVIEIKRPGTVTVSVNKVESELALDLPSPPAEFNGRLSKLRSSHWRHCEKDNLYGSRMRSGLFDLPEVYSPPPLRPQTPRHKLTIPSPKSPRLDGIMPSFVNTLPSSILPMAMQQTFTPRLAHSEPTLKSATRQVVPVPSNENPRPATSCLQRKLVRGAFSTTETSSMESNERTNQHLLHSLKNNQESLFQLFQPSPRGCNCNYDAKNKSNQLLGKRDDSYSNHGGTSNNDHITGNGAGDEVTHTPTKSMGQSHSSPSPRIRLSSRLQPSVITPAMAEALINECVANLRSLQWEDNFEAFSQIYSITEIHPSRVKNVLNKIIWHGLPHLSSPRTKLARMACVCFKRLFQTQKRSMEIEGEKVFYRLLDLCGAMSNSFIQQECKDALIAAVESMDPLKSVTFLELHGVKHKNPNVREFSAYLLNAIMDELPTSKLMNKDFSPRVIPMIVGFLKEGLLQTRLNAKLALDKIFDHSTFESKLRRYVSPENVRHIADTLREFRERRNGHI